MRSSTKSATQPPEILLAKSQADSAVKRFKTRFDDMHASATRNADLGRHTMAEKAASLIPVRMLLSQLLNMGVMVRNCDPLSLGGPMPLAPTEGPSSPTWAPGSSIFLEHPAKIEIAIPNSVDRARYGEIVIHLASPHPDAAMFSRQFQSVEEACNALADFLARNALTMLD